MPVNRQAQEIMGLEADRVSTNKNGLVYLGRVSY